MSFTLGLRLLGIRIRFKLNHRLEDKSAPILAAKEGNKTISSLIGNYK